MNIPETEFLSNSGQAWASPKYEAVYIYKLICLYVILNSNNLLHMLTCHVPHACTKQLKGKDHR